MAKTTAHVDRQLFEQALLLVVRQHGGSPDEAAAAARELADWEKRDALHANASRTAQEAWLQTDAQALRDQFALPLPASERKRQTRRRLTALLGVGGLTVLAGGLGHWYWQQPSFTLLARTGRGQIESHALPDGSRVDLAARSEVAIAYHRDRRLANLAAGEVRFDVMPDSQHPFEIETRHGRVRVLGTSFSVRVLDDGLRVAVAQGRVAVWRGGQPATALPDVELGQGEAIFVATDGKLHHSHVVPDDVGAWRQGWLVFDNIPLDKVVDRWNDYLAIPLEMEQRQALADMHLTGSFPLDNPVAFLETLPRTHPVNVVRQGGGRFLVRLRPGLASDTK